MICLPMYIVNWWQRFSKPFEKTPSNCPKSKEYIGGIHKPCGHDRGRGVFQMSILLHKPYLVKWSTKGEGGSKMFKNLSTWFMDDPLYKFLF